MPPDTNYPAMKLLALALDSLRAGRLAEAEARFQKVLAHQPTNTVALHQLSLLAHARGQSSDARALLNRAVDADPHNLVLLTSYGLLLHEIGESREALDVLLRVLSLDPSQPDIWNAAGICFQETGQHASAIEFYLRALNLRPDFADACNNLGVVLTHEGDTAGAIEHFRQALKINPGFPDCHSNLGVALRNRFEYATAIASFREAFRLKPDGADIVCSLGEVLSLVYDDSAEAILRRSVELSPGDPEKHWNYALELLKRGDYLAGWREYEWRWQRTRNQTPLPPFTQPFWHGEPGQHIAGNTILLHAEQGLGDTLQFLRYVPLVLAQGAHIVLQVQPLLHRLIAEYARQLPGAIPVVAAGDPLPPFDWHVPLMSLPQACGTTLDNIPQPQRFTSAPPRPSPPAHARPLRVGLALAGNPHHDRDRERSIPLEALKPLFDLPGYSWVSLQTGPAAAQLQQLDASIDQPPLHDFLDTATVIDSLDLVLTVDTAVAHLAASQGARTWILLPFVADWRWLRPSPHPAAVSTAPWYPQACLFRQRELPAGQPQTDLWKPVIAEVVDALNALSQSHRSSALP